MIENGYSPLHSAILEQIFRHVTLTYVHKIQQFIEMVIRVWHAIKLIWSVFFMPR